MGNSFAGFVALSPCFVFDFGLDRWRFAIMTMARCLNVDGFGGG